LFNQGSAVVLIYVAKNRMISLEAHANGVLLPVRAQPGSRHSGIRGEQAGALKVCVTQVAEKGKANKALIKVLCAALDLRPSQVELISGETAAQKRFLIRDITQDALAQRIAKCLESTTPPKK
jgi:uncharacterized protein (TIGR00251 family)